MAVTKQHKRNTLMIARLSAVLLEHSRQGSGPANKVADWLDDIIGIIAAEDHEGDFFGTEQQNDPRGDHRNGQWSVWKVEGMDK